MGELNCALLHFDTRVRLPWLERARLLVLRAVRERQYCSASDSSAMGRRCIESLSREVKLAAKSHTN
jgi:hypothetical protein